MVTLYFRSWASLHTWQWLKLKMKHKPQRDHKDHIYYVMETKRCMRIRHRQFDRFTFSPLSFSTLLSVTRWSLSSHGRTTTCPQIRRQWNVCCKGVVLSMMWLTAKPRCSSVHHAPFLAWRTKEPTWCKGSSSFCRRWEHNLIMGVEKVAF